LTKEVKGRNEMVRIRSVRQDRQSEKLDTKPYFLPAGVFSLLLLLQSYALAAFIQWTGPGANNHWYEMVQVADPYDWLAAKDLAEDS
jgi:hypothetical protein